MNDTRSVSQVPTFTDVGVSYIIQSNELEDDYTLARKALKLTKEQVASHKKKSIKPSQEIADKKIATVLFLLSKHKYRGVSNDIAKLLGLSASSISHYKKQRDMPEIKILLTKIRQR